MWGFEMATKLKVRQKIDKRINYEFESFGHFKDVHIGDKDVVDVSTDELTPNDNAAIESINEIC